MGSQAWLDATLASMSLAAPAGPRRGTQPARGVEPRGTVGGSLNMSGKTRILRRLALAGAGWMLLLCDAASGQQAPPPQATLTVLGTLSCDVAAESDANPAAQTRDLLCHFRPGAQGPEETYVGTMQGIGQTKRLFARGAVILNVKAPASTAIVPGMLQQAYSADAAPGAAAAALVGDRNRTIVLQPLAEEEGRVAEGKSQPDAVIIVVELTLRSSPA